MPENKLCRPRTRIFKGQKDMPFYPCCRMFTHLVSYFSSDEDPVVFRLRRCTTHRDVVHLREQ